MIVFVLESPKLGPIDDNLEVFSVGRNNADPQHWSIFDDALARCDMG